MAQFKRTDGYALMNAVMAQLTGQDNYQVIDAQGFMDAGKLAMEYKTDEIFNALTIVGARLFTATRPYKAPLWLIDSINSGYFNNRIRKISYYSTWALPSGAFNTNLYTNFADGYTNGENVSGSPAAAQSTKDMYEQHPVHPLELNFMNSTVWQDCLTRYEDQIKVAFSSEDEWARFWSGVLTEKGNDVEQRKEAHNRLTLLNRMAIASAIGDYSSDIKAVCTKIDLTDEYNKKFGTNYTGEQLRTTYLKSFVEFFISYFKQLSNKMTKRSLFYHIAPTLTLGDGDHYILRHTPKADQRFMMFTPFWEDAKALVMPEIFNDEYLKPEQFESVDFWQALSPDQDTCAAVNITATIPAWLEDLIADTTGSSDTAFTFKENYVLGCLYDKDSVLTDFQFETARTTPLEARKNYINTWMDFGLGAIGDPTENFILLTMGANVQATETFTGDGSDKTFVLTGNVSRILGITVGGTATTAYSYDADTKTVTFTSAPANNAEIKITYLVNT